MNTFVSLEYRRGTEKERKQLASFCVAEITRDTLKAHHLIFARTLWHMSNYLIFLEEETGISRG